MVAAVFTGLVPFTALQEVSSSGQAEALTMALDYAPSGVTLPQTVVAFGSVVAHTAVLLVFQNRIAAHFHVDGADGAASGFRKCAPTF